MANYFQEDEARPIVSAWIEQNFEIDKGFILEAIEADEQALSQDVTFSAVAAFGSIASGCLMLALAGFSAPMLIPVGVIVSAGLMAWNSDCAKGDRELEGRFLREYPQTFDRISQRVRAGEGVATIAAEYGQMFRAYRKSDRAALAQLTATATSETQAQCGLQNSDASNAPMTESPALAPTDLQPIAHGVAAAPSMSVVNGVETIAPRDIATDLGNNPQSALIFGTPGAGKGMNISNAIRTLRAKLPNVTVMMVDPKGDKKEIGYWESQVDIFESRALLKSSPRSSAEWMLRCVEKFSQIDGPKLLVWDELFASITVLKGQNVPKGEDAFPCLTEFQQFISLNLSLGPSSGIWVWGMSQSANLSDLGLTSGGLSTTRIIALVSPDNTGAVEGYLATKAITAPKGGMDTIDRLMEESPVGRACYDGKTKRWYPMARLENHSGFDRDSADWNNLNKVAPETRSPSNEVPSPATSKLSQGQVTWEYLKVGSPAFPTATDAIEVESWESEEAVEPKVYKTSIEDLKRLNEEADKRAEERHAREKVDGRLFKILEMVKQDGTVSVKDIQKKLKLDTSLEAQQLAQMFCLRNKLAVQFKSKNNANSTVSYFIERVT